MPGDLLMTPEELKSNNLRILKLRKKALSGSLSRYCQLLGYVFIILLYLKNISFLRFIPRVIMHRVLSDPFPSNMSVRMEDNVKRQLVKNFLIASLTLNLIFFLLDIIVGVPPDMPDSTFFNGSLTLQIIGETKPTTRWVYAYYNIAITVIQFVTLYMSSVLDPDADTEKHKELLPDSTYSINDIEGDGYTGRTTIATIHPQEIYNHIISFELPSETTETYNEYMGSRLNMSSMM